MYKMRAVIQRVKEAKVMVENENVGAIEMGLLIFIGVGVEDSEAVVDRYVDKILKLRIFSDENDKTNLSVQDVGGEVLVVSQFTLYADCKKGNRPNFVNAAEPKKAKELYEYFLSCIKNRLGKVACGRFGADMQVSLINDGPFTIVLDSRVIQKAVSAVGAFILEKVKEV